ncbi:hypothetical protein CLAFUW4_01265 [Fulvia fulva]|uniref:ATP-grasp domain-containing protein n=1 Tax=Passalora fulva TaxID=5499 RepID=A0A9Q8L769_PASFU|nr:uncharacterized protein CLAFUR5_01270 [Fulvia fulva]KAK4634514.1 hypothetical protein CLAFUR4_01266 [Fulvia fulva]KAK4638543.1 hypothetical protein CLAFUR0_01267 [Fulvia fulva]UJO11468.1 hypothetical protein CLAFUR5_01270 [Fulvia fulva]WPV09874.1 hypothetical protein CLAFUW4_01265 [Fulvia fulva]WPV24596.1 hypothetical protein CLAFUW7_01270 [Fulvia fulva]
MALSGTGNRLQRSQKRRTRRNDQLCLRIMLSNGRFPVSLDLARQLSKAGHKVFCVDPMRYHVCKFSVATTQCKQVPAPHSNPLDYIEAVKYYAIKWEIDMILPIHEEIFFLAGSGEPEILTRLFAPSFEMLVRLHHKFEFSKMMRAAGLGVPEAYLCTSTNDVANLPLHKYAHGMALKPCFGRASTGLHHLKLDEPMPDDLIIDEHHQYVAQEWLVGQRYCSYSVVRNGQVEATGLYPVLETIDGHSSVYFQQKFHAGIYDYVRSFVSKIPAFSGQIAFDFIEDADGIWAIESNPRAASGIHLWSDTTHLARAITGSLPKEEIERPIRPPRRMLGHEPHFQVAAGMLMWKHERATLKVWANHMRRLMFTRDVILKWQDPLPTIAQPFLLSNYYRMCWREHMQLPDWFQQQLIWEPQDWEWNAMRMMLAKSSDEEDEYYDCVDSQEEHSEV